MALNRLAWKEFGASVHAKGCVITLHGRGTSGEDLMPIAQEIHLSHLRWVFPDAPFPFPDLLGGLMWYSSTAGSASEVQTSRKLLFDLLDHMTENKQVPPENIALLGFSQGAVMSLDVGLRYPKKIGAIIALSGFLAAPDTLSREKSRASESVPILLAHGTMDEVVPVKGSRDAQSALLAEGYSPELREYAMGHQIIAEEITLIRNYLMTHLGLP
ncbi:MAG: alpha/beta hydrolase [Nitrospiria bacterium]